MLTQRDPEDLGPYFMRAFTLEALGRYQDAAAESRHIIGWLEAHNDTLTTTCPRKRLQPIQAIPATADTGVSDSNE